MEFFDTLPDIVFLRIYDYLPLTDRFRLGRVSQSFLRISQIVNGRIESLNLHESMFDKLDVDQFEVILRLCRHNLRQIKFTCSVTSADMVLKLSQFPCAQLVDLDLDYASITNDGFARIITNHPNLKSLKWRSMYEHNDDDDDKDYDGNGRVPLSEHVQFPPITLPHLETLDMQLSSGHMSDVTTLESLIDRCPNLKELKMDLDQASSEDVWDRFFRSVPRLESLQMDLYDCQVRMENLEWFWRLPLTSLKIHYQRPFAVEFIVNDDFVNKLVENFTNIEQLDMSLVLASVTDEAIRKFSSCRHLEHLSIYSSAISDQTFLKLFRNCPNLRSMTICGVYDDNRGLLNAEAVSMLLYKLANVPHRPSINFHVRPLTFEDAAALYSSWHSPHVQNVVDSLKQNHGIEVNIGTYEHRT